MELALRPFLAAAQRAVERSGCEVVMRAYDPVSLPALYLVSRSAAFNDQLAATRDRADELWGGVLDALAATAPPDRPQLVLNHRNPLVRRVTMLGDPELVGLAVEALYGQALLLGHHPIRPADAALLNDSFLGLLGRAVPGRDVSNERPRICGGCCAASPTCRTGRGRSPPWSSCCAGWTPRTTAISPSSPGCRPPPATSTAASRRSPS